MDTRYVNSSTVSCPSCSACPLQSHSSSPPTRLFCGPSQLHFVGPALPHERAAGVACGDLNPHTGKPFREDRATPVPRVGSATPQGSAKRRTSSAPSEASKFLRQFASPELPQTNTLDKHLTLRKRAKAADDGDAATRADDPPASPPASPLRGTASQEGPATAYHTNVSSRASQGFSAPRSAAYAGTRKSADRRPFSSAGFRKVRRNEMLLAVLASARPPARPPFTLLRRMAAAHHPHTPRTTLWPDLGTEPRAGQTEEE